MANPLGRFSQHDKQKINWKAVIHEKYFIYNIFNFTAFFGDKNHIISNNCILGIRAKYFSIFKWIFGKDFDQISWCTFACYVTNLYRLIL